MNETTSPELAQTPEEAREAVAESGPFLPPWWHDEPAVRGGRLHLWVWADAETLAQANRSAVESGRETLRRVLIERGLGEKDLETGDFRTEAVAADLVEPGVWRSFVELSVSIAHR